MSIESKVKKKKKINTKSTRIALRKQILKGALTKNLSQKWERFLKGEYDFGDFSIWSCSILSGGQNRRSEGRIEPDDGYYDFEPDGGYDVEEEEEHAGGDDAEEHDVEK